MSAKWHKLAAEDPRVILMNEKRTERRVALILMFTFFFTYLKWKNVTEKWDNLNLTKILPSELLFVYLYNLLNTRNY